MGEKGKDVEKTQDDNEKEEIIAPFLKGEAIDLLPINFEHINLYIKWFNLEELRMYSRNEFPQTKEEIKKKIKSKEKGEERSILLDIWHKKDKKIIGVCGLIDINWFNRFANILIILDPQYQRKSIGTEVGKLLINYGFLELNLKKIISTIMEPNISGWKTAEKIGFELEAKLKDEAYVEGKFFPERQYAVFREDWTAVRNKK
ncbi:MAG: GNAT family N-acetyltransferase [Promethearchaeati archaeon]